MATVSKVLVQYDDSRRAQACVEQRIIAVPGFSGRKKNRDAECDQKLGGDCWK